MLGRRLGCVLSVMEAERTRVLLIGPMPPPANGMTVLTDALLRSSLTKEFDVRHLDISDHRDISNVARIDLRNVLLALLHGLKFLWALAALRPEIVHVQVARDRLGFLRDALFLIPARLTRRRVLLHLHASGFDNFYAEAPLWLRLIVRLAISPQWHAAVLSPSFTGTFEPLISRERVFVMPNGIDDPTPNACAEGCDSFVLHLSTLWSLKGTFEVLEAADRLRDELPGVRFVFAGGWFYDHERTLAEKFVRERRLESSVEFSGPVSGDQKRDLLRRACVFALPTRHPTEGQPVAVLEALASATPVVASAIGAMPDMITDGVEGFLIEHNDFEAFVDRLRMVVTDRERRTEMARAARARYDRDYTLDLFAGRVRDVWVTMLATTDGREVTETTVAHRGRGATLPQAALIDLSAALHRTGSTGWDPYDALSSPSLRAVARSPLLRRAAIQSVKRSPLNLRRVLGVRPARNAKALALLISAHVLLGDVDRARELAHDLVDLRIGTPRAGWGYGFDVQTRWGYYRAGTPNAVVTAFACHALLDVGGFAEIVEDAREYALEHLAREEGGRPYFAYYPGSRTLIHNANLLVSGVFARSAEGEPLETARAAALSSVHAQSRDGSWPYGMTSALGWVDGYHTLYNLDATALWYLRTHENEFEQAIGGGLDLYLSRLVDPDGAPRATLASRFPIDIHACSTAITTLTRLAPYDPRALPTAERVLSWTLDAMRRRDGRFAYQRHRFYRNSVPYLRWNDASMLLALATYVVAVRG